MHIGTPSYIHIVHVHTYREHIIFQSSTYTFCTWMTQHPSSIDCDCMNFLVHSHNMFYIAVLVLLLETLPLLLLHICYFYLGLPISLQFETLL
jgi:hypothetical protein